MFREQNPSQVGIITLAILLITGLAFVPALDVKADSQNAKLAQIKNWVLKTSCSKLISPLAQVIAKSYPGVSTASITLLLQQMVKEVTTNSGQAKACQDLKQIAYQILSNPQGIVASSLVMYVKQITSQKTTYEVVVKEIYKSSSGGSGGNNNRGSSDINCIGICGGIFITVINYCESNAKCINNINNINQQLVSKSAKILDPNALQLASLSAITLAAANSPTGDIASVTIPEDESLNLLNNVNGNLEQVLPITPGGPTPTEAAATIVPTSPTDNGAITPPVDGTPEITSSTPLEVSGVPLPPPEDTSDSATTPTTTGTLASTPPAAEGDSSALPPAAEGDSSDQSPSESEGDNNGIDFSDLDVDGDSGDSGGDGGGDSGGDGGGDSGGDGGGDSGGDGGRGEE